MRTSNKKQTIEALWAVAKGKSDCKDNHFFIGKDGEILGHGYLQGNEYYFPKYPAGMKLDMVVVAGMKRKDIIEQIEIATNEE